MRCRRLGGGVAVAWLMLSWASPAAAQIASRAPEAADGQRGFMTRYRFYMGASRLGAGDPRFVWDADFGGDVDLVDFGDGRITVQANFEAILGEQFRRFDPNQGNYLLGISASVRKGPAEVSAVFHHVSRHLSDRPKPFPIDWNMVGVRTSLHVEGERLTVGGEARALWTVTRSFVDYAAEVGGGLDLRYAFGPHAALIAHGDAYWLLVDQGVSARDHQQGGRIEGGVRLSGSRGAVDLFVGYERRVDADPFEFLSHSWLLFGFRLLSAD